LRVFFSLYEAKKMAGIPGLKVTENWLPLLRFNPLLQSELSMNKKYLKICVFLSFIWSGGALSNPNATTPPNPNAPKPPANAEPQNWQPYSSRISGDVKIIKHQAGMTQLYGTRYIHMETAQFFIGGAGYSGQLTSGGAGSFSYGGIVSGWETILSPRTKLEISILAGGGGGFNVANAIATHSGGVALEPSLSYAFILGPQARIAANFGYLWMPSSTIYTGVSAGVRFDFSIQNITR
jgi:hypothetical protein